MSKSLVIVESPAKAKTISKFLGSPYRVLACKGHVRALPSKQGSVVIGEDIVPRYDLIPSSRRYLKEISKELKGSDVVYLATDLDREGEAIAWHLVQALELEPGDGRPAREVKRITFHEITREAIREALASPGTISTTLVNAQQARVVLDYLVGFNLSPFLWKKIRYGLSAGRVQSVALRMICEREKEIRAFEPCEYWSIKARLEPRQDPVPFEAQLVEARGAKLEKLSINAGEAAQRIVDELGGAAYTVRGIKKREVKRNPPPPFITSTLQQDASRKLGFSARRTMALAQQLYEGVDVGSGTMGLITYMRTDSVNLAESALQEIRTVILERYGTQYALATPRRFVKKSRNAQEAHEAIRPTDVAILPDAVHNALTRDQHRLYELIWKRAVASQMAQAVLDAVSVDIVAGDGFVFRATGSTLRFDGFMTLYTESSESGDDDRRDTILPPLHEGQDLHLLELLPEQHFTQPPPRFTEASLVKALEENGIGRPSTYASIISILQDREYVKQIKKRFHPEDIGMVVNDLLTTHFARYVDYDFTSRMEDRLDSIARGELEWKPAIRQFWEPFIERIRQKEEEVSKADVTTEPTNETCPECGKALVIKLGKYGRFYACSGFPECRYVRPLESAAGEDARAEADAEPCQECGSPMVLRQGKYGRFLGCSRYPDCRFVQPLHKPVSLGVTCPECGQGELQEKKSRRGKVFYGCSRYPDCTFALWDKPIGQPCPQCGSPYLVEKNTKRTGHIVKCPRKGCAYNRPAGEADS